MEAIIVLSGESQKEQLLIACLMLLFPDCAVHIVSTHVAGSKDDQEQSVYFDCHENEKGVGGENLTY